MSHACEIWDFRVGGTALHRAARLGDLQSASELLAAGANVNASDKFDVTPLHNAALCEHEEVARLLLEYGADVERKTDNGWTPLHSATCRGSVEVVDLLIQSGADVNAAEAQDDMGICHMPLYYAIEKRNFLAGEYDLVADLLKQHRAIYA